MRRSLRGAAVVVATVAAVAGGAVSTNPASGAGVPAPTLTAPANSTAKPLKDVVLQWAPVAGASTYQVQLSPNGQWTNNAVTLPNSGLTVNPRYELPVSLPHASYFWRVRALVAGTWSGYSSPREFLREWDVPFTMLQTPSATDPTLAWTPVADASLYQVRFSPNPSFATDVSSCWTHQTSFTPYTLTSATETESLPCFADLDPGSYYWEVVAYDDSSAPRLVSDATNDPNYDCAQAQPECDAARQFGGPVSFTGAPAGSGATAAPAGLRTSWRTASLTGTTCTTSLPCPVTPTFSWSPVTGAGCYHVHVFRDPGLSDTYRAYDVRYPQLTPRDSYLDAQAGQAYYWVVAAGTWTDGACVPTTAASAAAGFHKVSGMVSLTSPADGAVTHGVNPTFGWQDFEATGGFGAYDARNYELQVAPSRSFANPVIDASDIDLTQYTDPSAVLANGSYFWRVAGIDESGNLLRWSTVRSFTVNATVPQFRISTPSGIAVTRSLTVKASEPVTGVSASTVHLTVLGAGGVRNLAGRLTLGTTPTTWVFHPRSPLATGARYQLAVSPTVLDQNGNSAVVVGPGVRTTRVAKATSRGWSFHGSWAHNRASDARSHGYRSSGHGSASVVVAGAEAVLYACKAPSMGSVTVTVAGRSHTVSEHQSYTRCGVEVWHGALPKGTQRLTVTVDRGVGSVDEVRMTGHKPAATSPGSAG